MNNNQNNCPDDNIFLAFLDNALPEATALDVEQHIAQCAICSELMIELGHMLSKQTPSTVDDKPQHNTSPKQTPKTLGRYHLKQLIGAGGMGAVYEALDPELNRRVAIKIIRPDKQDNQQIQRHIRLKREAQALASLTHPNVLTVYDVGQDDERIWIAMEFIDGQSITHWIDAQTPSWREILSVYHRAGQGLIAAHQHGLIHRDIKPDNILIGKDGRVLLMDFGLAFHNETTHTQQTNATDEPLTQTGIIVGTPAYMPPEQLTGKKLNARSDQYAFCVALFEGIYGFRPFRAQTPESLIQATQSGALTKPRSKDVPDRLFDVLQRGLSPRPDEGWASMETLLAELERAANPPIWRHLKIAMPIGIMFLLAIGVGIYINHKASTVPPDQFKTQPKRTTPEVKQLAEAPKTLPTQKLDDASINEAKKHIYTSLNTSLKTQPAPKKPIATKEAQKPKRKSRSKPKKQKLAQGAAPIKRKAKGSAPPKIVHGPNFTEAKRQKVKAFHATLMRSHIPSCQGFHPFSQCEKAVKRVRAVVGAKPVQYLDNLRKLGANPKSVQVMNSVLSAFYVLAADEALKATKCKRALEYKLTHMRIWEAGDASRPKYSNNVSVWKKHLQKDNPKCKF